MERHKVTHGKWDRGQRRAPEAQAGCELSERFTGNLAIPRYELDGWRSRHGIVAGITGRGTGFDFNWWSRDSAGTVMTRWRAFRQAIGRQFPCVVLSHQRHGKAVEPVHAQANGLVLKDGLDGHTTRTAGVLLAVTVADCVPVYLLHPPTGAVGLLHAGWRGTAEGILAVGVHQLCEVAGGEPQEIVMHCGVSICGQCYEVGPEVIQGVQNRPAEAPELLDLRAVLRDRALALGIREASASRWCTSHDHDRFYSHRRSHGASGRMIAYIGRPFT